MVNYDSDNIFAKIIRGELPADKVYEDNEILAFKDISPAAPVHILVIPKGEYLSLDDFVQKAEPQLIAKFWQTVQKIAAEQNLIADGYRIITNHGKNATQTVPHFHVHIIGGRALGALVP